MERSLNGALFKTARLPRHNLQKKVIEKNIFLRRIKNPQIKIFFERSDLNITSIYVDFKYIKIFSLF